MADLEFTEENRHWVESEETAQERIRQARSLKEQAEAGGLRFEAYLPSDLAVWVLGMVERGIFIDPSEAVFVLMGQAHDIEPHQDIKKEILKRRIQQGENGVTYTLEEVMQSIDEEMHQITEPAIWQKIGQPTV